MGFIKTKKQKIAKRVCSNSGVMEITIHLTHHFVLVQMQYFTKKHYDKKTKKYMAKN